MDYIALLSVKKANISFATLTSVGVDVCTAASLQSPLSREFSAGARPGGASKLVRGAEAAPVPAIDADRHVDLAHHDGFAVAHVAGVALDQVGAQVAAGGEARGIAEDAAVAAVGAVPHHIARALRMRVDFVVHRKVAVAVNHRAEHHARVLGEESLLKRRPRASG